MDKPIADLVLECIAKHKADGLPSFTHSEKRRHRQYLANVIRSSRKFFLDDETTTEISNFGYTHPDVLLYGLSKARIPFEKILIDYSPRAQVLGVGHEPLHGAPKRTAIFVERLSSSLFRMTGIGADENFAMFVPSSIKYNLEETISESKDLSIFIDAMINDLKLRGASIMDKDGKIVNIKNVEFNNSSIEYTIQEALLGTNYSTFGNLEKEEQLYHDQQRRRLLQHARWELNPVTEGAFKRLLKETNDEKILFQLKSIINESVVEWSGTWRFLISFLILLNQQDFISEIPFKMGDKSRLIKGHNVPYMEHRLIKLKIPRKSIIRKLIQRVGESIPRRRHEVIGHWRHRRGIGIEDGSCEHAFINVTSDRQKCFLCNYDRWWVNEHLRGDASIGIITKDYTVEY